MKAKALARIYKTKKEADEYVSVWGGEIIPEGGFFSVYFIPVPIIVNLKSGSVGEWIQKASLDDFIEIINRGTRGTQ